MHSSNAKHRKHGFRCSWFDLAILLCAMVSTLWLHGMQFPLRWIVPMVAGNFFLFCNVFLVWQRWELLQAGVFVLNFVAHSAIDHVDGASVLLWQSPATIVVILLRIRSPWYHGIFAGRLDPRLADLLDDHAKFP